MTGLRVWTRPEIADAAEQTARQEMHSARCLCCRCCQIRAGRDAIQEAAQPVRRPRSRQ
ncbi:hypothetical protein [Micromonospora carbonacea]|uniref:hypothetical protein n=1 Tax=Micromonospora carbonacea TaxID=47853 RepID=UPI00159F2772|nr:hypothetical protein [Micromonospora carbonacea]